MLRALRNGQLAALVLDADYVRWIDGRNVRGATAWRSRFCCCARPRLHNLMQLALYSCQTTAASRNPTTPSPHAAQCDLAPVGEPFMLPDSVLGLHPNMSLILKHDIDESIVKVIDDGTIER